MSQTEEDKKPSGDQAAHINLKVKGQLGNELPPEKRESVENLTEKGASAGIPFSDDPFPLLFHLCLFFSQIRDGNEVFFRIKRSTQLKKLMNAYCDRQSVDFNSIAFLFDGRRLRAEQTPDELEMEDGDEIDAMLHQTGGSTV